MSQSQYDFNTTQIQNILIEQRLKKNPFTFVNRVIREQIKNERLFDLIVPLGVHFIANIILQPFNVVGTLLQLQYMQPVEIIKKQTINNLKENQVQKSLTKNIKQIAITQKKKIDLQILSDVKQKSFISINIGYKQVIKDLINQGYNSFSKGLISSSLLQVFRSSFRYGIISPYLYRQNGQDNIALTAILSYSALTLYDITFNCLHMAESRFILQNIQPELPTYISVRSFIKNNLKQKRWMFDGWKTHFIRNLFIIPVGLNMNNQLFLLNFFIAYPINTAYKRILCQSTDVGMIPHKYNSVWHALRLIYQQQGFKGLYRGSISNGIRQFSLFNIFTIIYSSMVFNQNSYWIASQNETEH